jgi:hypothetical protein
MKYLIILKYSYLGKQVKVLFNGIRQDPSYCYIMNKQQIEKLQGWFSGCKLDTEQERKLQIKYAKHDNYDMMFVDVLPDTLITVEL